MHDSSKKYLSWELLEPLLEKLKPVKGGFTNSISGTIELSDGSQLFVKQAQDSDTTIWTKKEIEIYKILNHHNFEYAPKLISYNKQGNAFAIESMTHENGWDWSEKWTDNRIEAIFRVQLSLASVPLSLDEIKIFAEKNHPYFHNGWIELFKSKSKQKIVTNKLPNNFNIDFIKELYLSQQFKPVRTAIVHNDLRSSNSVYSKKLDKVMLVDWPWSEIGDSRIDTNALLVNVSLSGFDITKKYLKKLDFLALHYLAGFWFESSTKEYKNIHSKPAHELQFNSAIKALELANLMHKFN